MTWSSGPAVPLRFRVFLAMPQDYPKAATAIGRYDDDKRAAAPVGLAGEPGRQAGTGPGNFRLSSKAAVTTRQPGSVLLSREGGTHAAVDKIAASMGRQHSA